MTTKLVVSLDGGGMKGLISVAILSHLGSLGFDLIDRADLVGGTSTGGIVALSKVFGIPNQGLEVLFSSLGGLIFGGFKGSNDYTKIIKENTMNLEIQMNAMFGQYPTFSSFHPDKHLFLTTSSKSDDQDNGSFITEVLSNYDTPLREKKEGAELSVVQAVRATGAIPFYLTPLRVNGSVYVDGGLLSNNVDSIAYQEARALYPDANIILVSIGAGYHPQDTNHPLRVTSELTQSAELVDQYHQSVSSSRSDHLQATKSFDNTVSYVRFDPLLSHPISLDDQNALPDISASVSQYIESQEFKSLTDVLSKLLLNNIQSA